MLAYEFVNAAYANNEIFIKNIIVLTLNTFKLSSLMLQMS